jgi:hypothetical protein
MDYACIFREPHRQVSLACFGIIQEVIYDISQISIPVANPG